MGMVLVGLCVAGAPPPQPHEDFSVFFWPCKVPSQEDIILGVLFLLPAAAPLSHMRISGVLQRLAFTYFVVAITELCASQLYRRKSVSFECFQVVSYPQESDFMIR